VLALALAVSSSAYAQRPRPDRPYRGLFGGNGSDPANAQQFDLNASLYGAYDDNVLADRSPAGFDPRYQKSGGYGGGSLSLDYTANGRRADVDLSAGTLYRNYPSNHQLSGFSYLASVGLSVRLNGRTTVRATESGNYTPYYAFGAFTALTDVTPGEIVPSVPDYPLVKQALLSYTSAAALDYRMSRRATLAADYYVQNTDYTESDVRFRSWSAGAMWSYRLSSRATARIGYHYRHAVSPFYYANQPIVGHDADVGVDYSRALSFSRKTTYGFSTGSSIFRSFSPVGAVITTTDWQYKTHFTLIGNAYLNREIGRSWNVRLEYRRGLQFVQSFPDPLFSDSVTATARGYLGERSQLHFMATYSNGDVGVALTGRTYDTYAGVASYQYALGRMFAIFAEYDYYHYQFDPSVPLPPGVNRGLNRGAGRVGLNLWLPLLRAGKREQGTGDRD
jgi:hypothetical protein